MNKPYNSKHHKEYVINKIEFSNNDKKTLLAKLFDLECICTSNEKAIQKIKREIKIIEKLLLDFITNFANDYLYNRNFSTNFFNDNCEPKVEDKLILATDECMAIIANYKQKLKFLFRTSFKMGKSISIKL